MTPTAPSPTTAAPTNPAAEAVNGASGLVLDPAMIPNLDNVVTEDDTPLDSVFVEKQERLLTRPLYSSWAGPGEGRTFLALTNVGLFHTVNEPPLVPDGLLSLDVKAAQDLFVKGNRSYFLWIMGKPPEVIIEIVSDRHSREETFKRTMYARLRVFFYVIFDPENILENGVLRAFVLERGKYKPIEPGWFEEVGLGFKLWEGTFEGIQGTWLRWCDQRGQVIPTGEERAKQTAESLQQTEESLQQANEKIQRLEAQLRALGAEPQG